MPIPYRPRHHFTESASSSKRCASYVDTPSKIVRESLTWQAARVLPIDVVYSNQFSFDRIIQMGVDGMATDYPSVARGIEDDFSQK